MYAFGGVTRNLFTETENIFQSCNYTNDQLSSLVDINTGGYSQEDSTPPSISQTSNLNINEDNDSNDDSIFKDINGIPLAHETNESCHIRNPYGYLKPYFSQMIDCLEGQSTMDELVGVKDMLMNIINNKRQEINERRCCRKDVIENDHGSPESNKRAKYSSSNVASETKSKPHGTKHY